MTFISKTVIAIYIILLNPVFLDKTTTFIFILIYIALLF